MIKHTYIIPLETPRSITDVQKLLQIEKRSQFEIETTLELITGKFVKGEIIEIEGYNPLVFDEFIPINFVLFSNNKTQIVSFKEIKLD